MFRVGLFSNPPLIGAGLVGLAFMTCVSYVPFLQRIFNTAPLSIWDWLMLVGFGVLLLAADETRKAVRRHSDVQRQPVATSEPTQGEG
jgi:magnesium-transporting ATPase (P-type)